LVLSFKKEQPFGFARRDIPGQEPRKVPIQRRVIAQALGWQGMQPERPTTIAAAPDPMALLPALERKG